MFAPVRFPQMLHPTARIFCRATHMTATRLCQCTATAVHDSALYAAGNLLRDITGPIKLFRHIIPCCNTKKVLKSAVPSPADEHHWVTHSSAEVGKRIGAPKRSPFVKRFI